jgi:hypothetical protein
MKNLCNGLRPTRDQVENRTPDLSLSLSLSLSLARLLSLWSNAYAPLGHELLSLTMCFSSFPTDCRGDQDLWMGAEPSWTLEVQGDHVTDFRDPAAFLVAHEITHTITLYNRDYQIR